MTLSVISPCSMSFPLRQIINNRKNGTRIERIQWIDTDENHG
jgi:hypothetical protein